MKTPLLAALFCKATASKGRIALQAEGGEVEFRKVELTALEKQPMFSKIAVLVVTLSVPLSAVPVFIGTNTGSAAGGSKGIYLADFDPAAGKLSKPVLAAEYRQPGFLALHPSKPVLLAVGAPRQAFADRTSAVAAFAIEPGPKLRFLGEVSSAGKGACHLAVDPTGMTVAVANYGDGRISTLRLDENGVPGAPVSVITNTGSGPETSRQEGPHAHGVYFDRAGTRLYVPDLGLDRVWIYPFDPATSKLGAPLPSLVTAPGAGPRHLALSADEEFAFVVNELDNTVLVAKRENGGFTGGVAVSTLPEGFSGKNTTAEVELSPDGRFLYASNRGHDSIAVCRRVGGTVSLVQNAPCGGRTPRHFKISPCGRWLLCAHQDSHTISVLPRDPGSGRLGVPVSTVPSPNPICLLFLTKS
ncbi:MAG: beta-propeller fold lactonase family protein [Akkermansiaceae bacterium]|nr:beta-propeller fold lactonase family protein [Akkermansiaceae bacterium]MCF7733338.1 beta-propeller fold lactonase family protein [Akkermansiaceae bacterium]